MPPRVPKGTDFGSVQHFWRFWSKPSGRFGQAVGPKEPTDSAALKTPRGALLVDPGYEKQVKMVFGRVVCRGARSRASGYPEQPALLVSGGQLVGRPVYDGRVETH